MTRRSIRFAAILLATGLAGCTGTAVPGTNSTSNTNAPIPVTESTADATLPPAATVDLPDRFASTLDGTIDALPVRVRLARENDRITGEYVYETGRPAMRTVVELLTLEGSIDSTGSVRLDETAYSGRDEVAKTGAFEGTLTNTTLGKRFIGTWTKPDGSKSLPVVLSELTTTPGGMQFVSTSMPVADRRLAEVVKASYPKAEGGDPVLAAAFTNAIEGFTRSQVREFASSALENLGGHVTVDMLALEIDYEIAVATDDIVCVVFTEYSNLGGAHPSSAVYARTYEFARGRFLTLTDLTGDTRSFLALVSQKCRAILPKEGAFATDLEPDAANFSEWYVTRRGLTFVFSVPHVAGDTMQAYLPFADVKGALNADGPLGALIR